jgi:hypothetical protein
MGRDSIVLVRIDWKDREGNRWADAALLRELQEAAREIRLANGTFIADTRLEER